MHIKKQNPIFHFHAKIISRSFRSRDGGRSSVAAAAYRAGEKLCDDQLEKTYDFRKKSHDVSSEIIIPKQSQPNHKWLLDRQALWNHIERLENRINSQLCREIEFALPLVLNQQQNFELAKEFITTQFVEKFNMLADMCIHWKEGNPHVHVMFPLRPLTSEGFGKKENRKNLEQFMAWRKAWEEICNQHLEKAGYPELKIDCRSYKERGILRKPTIHIGPSGQKAVDKVLKLKKIERFNRYIVPEEYNSTGFQSFLNAFSQDTFESKRSFPNINIQANSKDEYAKNDDPTLLNRIKDKDCSLEQVGIANQESSTINYKNNKA